MMGRVLGLIMVAMTLPPATPVAQIAVGDPLPALEGELLTGRNAVLPQDASGRVALLMLGFTYESRFQVEAWAKRFRQDFGKEPRVTFFEIPIIGGLAKLGKWFIDGGGRVAWSYAGSLDEKPYQALSPEVSTLPAAER